MLQAGECWGLQQKGEVRREMAAGRRKGCGLLHVGRGRDYGGHGLRHLELHQGGWPSMIWSPFLLLPSPKVPDRQGY